MVTVGHHVKYLRYVVFCWLSCIVINIFGTLYNFIFGYLNNLTRKSVISDPNNFFFLSELI